MALYLIHRSRVRIMLGNEYLAKADAIAAYELEPTNEDLVPVLARLFPNDSIPAVDKYRNRFFPQIQDKKSDKGEFSIQLLFYLLLGLKTGPKKSKIKPRRG